MNARGFHSMQKDRKTTIRDCVILVLLILTFCVLGAYPFWLFGVAAGTMMYEGEDGTYLAGFAVFFAPLVVLSLLWFLGLWATRPPRSNL
jgi:small neutral amino acid transporter SnatA (MarC family)